MNATDYRTRALKMESHLNDLPLTRGKLVPALAAAAVAGESIDLMKRLAFYTKKPDLALHAKKSIANIVELKDAMANGHLFSADHLDARLVHGILGMISEASEFATELLNAITQKRPINVENMIEELGDLDWYKTLTMDALRVTQEQVWAGNVAKLETRYASGANPQATAHDPANRDKAAEMRAMNAAAAGKAEAPASTPQFSIGEVPAPVITVESQRVSSVDLSHTYKLQKGQLQDHPRGKWVGVMAESIEDQDSVQVVLGQFGTKPITIELHEDVVLEEALPQINKYLKDGGFPVENMYLYFVIDQYNRVGFALSQAQIVGVVEPEPAIDEATAELTPGDFGIDEFSISGSAGLLTNVADDVVVEPKLATTPSSIGKLLDALTGSEKLHDKIAAEARANCEKRVRTAYERTRGGPGYDAVLQIFGMTRVTVKRDNINTLIEKVIELNNANGMIVAIVPDPSLVGQYGEAGFVVCQTPPSVKDLLGRLAEIGSQNRAA